MSSSTNGSNISITIFHVSLFYKILVALMAFSVKLKGGRRFSYTSS